MGLCVRPPDRCRSREEQEIWDRLLVRRSEFERATVACELLSGRSQQYVNAELAETRRQYRIALEAFSAYVYSTFPATAPEPVNARSVVLLHLGRTRLN
jgi:hypothetical protein